MQTLILGVPGSVEVRPALAACVQAPVLVTDTAQAWRELHARPYDLLVVDGIKARTARALLHQLRQTRSYVLPDPWLPVLVIGTEEPRTSQAQLLDAGADAWMDAGCDDKQLAATIRAICRRRAHGRPVVVPRGLVLNRVSRLLLRDGAGIPLTPPEFTALTCLMEARPEPVSSRELGERLGARHDVRSVQSVMFQLRTKVGRTAVETVRGQGYRLTVDAHWSDDAGPLSAPPAAAESTALPPLSPPLADVHAKWIHGD